MKESETFLSFKRRLFFGVKAVFLLCLGQLVEKGPSVYLSDSHTQPVKFPRVQAGYLTNLCKAPVNNLYQAGGDKLNTPILSKTLWRHQDGAKLQGEGSSADGNPSLSRREDAAVKKMKCNEILFHA